MKTLLIVTLGISAAMVSQASAVEYVRKNASTEAAQEDILALDRALKKMRQMGCQDPTSWYYQGAIHALPPQVDNNQLCPQYKDYQTDLLTAWNNCTHPQPQLSSDDKIEGLHFLLWHRMYIAYFEQIVRQLSGKKDFALPYWSYTDPDYRALPAMLRDKNSSLYEPARLPALNNGIAVGQAPNEGPSKRIEINQALDVEDLMTTRVFTTFSDVINAAPHGFMHDYIGGGYDGYTTYNSIYQKDNMEGLMSLVPSAGFDPVFWLHHSEIDRIWESWNQSSYGRPAPKDELLNHPWPYVFFDAAGKEHSYNIDQAYEASYNINYAYDSLIGTDGKDLPSNKKLLTQNQVMLTERPALKRHEIWSENYKINPAEKSSEVVLRPADLAESGNEKLLMNTKSKALVMKVDVSFIKEPSNFYVVYIKNSDGELDKAGAMTFFGAGHHHDHSHGAKMSTSFDYDVSDELKDGHDYDIVIRSGNGEAMDIDVDKVTLFSYE